MIIKGERVSSSRAVRPLVEHLLRGAENDAVTLVQGTEDDIYSAFGDARALGRNYAVRHFIISPAEEMSRDDALMVVGLLGEEFGFTTESAIVVEHAKPRAVADAFQTHWHALVPEQNVATGKTISSRFSYLRNEKCARISEYRLRHRLVIGPHSASVLSALENGDHNEVAAALKAAMASAAPERPREDFSSDVHQMGKRKGLDIPGARAHIRAAWDTTTTREAFEGALAANQLCVRMGNKHNTYIIESMDGVFVGAAHRLARTSREEFLHRMKDYHDVTATTTLDEPQGIFRTPPYRDQQRQDKSKPARSSNEFRHGRPVVDHYGIDPQGCRRGPSQPGSDSSAHRRDRAIRAGRRSRHLREALRAGAARTETLVRRSRFLASSPVDRVAAELYQYESRLDTQLKELLAPPAESETLLENRRLAEKLNRQLTGVRAGIVAAQSELEAIMAAKPHGLRAKFDGRDQRWQAEATRAKAECERLKQEQESLTMRLNLFRDTIAASEAAAASRHLQHLRSAPVADRRSRLQADIERVQRARKILATSPFLAWGGVAMVMAAISGISTAFAALEAEFGPGPFPKAFATDIWGVGLPGY